MLGNSIENHVIRATDGNVGQVKDFYFDDNVWAIRYLVVACGHEMPTLRGTYL